jgi:hypothetical protein
MKVMNWAPYPAIRCESSPPRRSAGSSLLSGARAHACRTIPLNCLRGLIVAFLKTIKFIVSVIAIIIRIGIPVVSVVVVSVIAVIVPVIIVVPVVLEKSFKGFLVLAGLYRNAIANIYKFSKFSARIIYQLPLADIQQFFTNHIVMHVLFVPVVIGNFHE